MNEYYVTSKDEFGNRQYVAFNKIKFYFYWTWQREFAHTFAFKFNALEAASKAGTMALSNLQVRRIK